MAFQFAFCISGSQPLYETFVIKDTVVVLEGMMMNVESSEVDLGAAADTALVGIAASDADNTDDGLSVRCIVNRDAVYSVTDANARTVDADLDLGSDGLTVTTDSSHTFKVFRTSTATEPTLVYINADNHWLDA